MQKVYSVVTPVNRDEILDALTAALFDKKCVRSIVNYRAQEQSLEIVEVGVIHSDSEGISIRAGEFRASLGVNHDRRSLEIDGDVVTFIEYQYASSKKEREVTYKPLPN
jgi:hypothetical protein